MDSILHAKLRTLQKIIGRNDRCAIAVSGGVDSAFLTKVACDVLGREKVVAVFIDSVLQSSGEKEHVEGIASEIGCNLLVLHVDPFTVPQFADNPPNRCYFCKKTIYSLIRDKIAQNPAATLMDGTNFDDLSDTRPGLQALRELQVVTPLAEVKIGKAEIRKLSKEKGLSNWNRPSGSCLATRIPFGKTITPEVLKKIDHCERYLHSLNFFGCRVRLQDNYVLVELILADKIRFGDPDVMENVKDNFLAAGFGGMQLSSIERKM